MADGALSRGGAQSAEGRCVSSAIAISTAIWPVNKGLLSEHDSGAHMRKRFEVDRWFCPRCGAAAEHTALGQP